MVAELAQRPVDPALDRGERLAQRLGDLGHGQLGAEAQGDRLALLGAERRERALDNVAVLDGVAELRARGWGRPDALERPALGRGASRVVAEEVQGDRVEPRLGRAA